MQFLLYNLNGDRFRCKEVSDRFRCNFFFVLREVTRMFALQVNTLLKQMTAETLENDVGVVDLPDLTQVKFTLLGKNKIDVAYQLEEKVRNEVFCV